jgi:hypothetical protein
MFQEWGSRVGVNNDGVFCRGKVVWEGAASWTGRGGSSSGCGGGRWGGGGQDEGLGDCGGGGGLFVVAACSLGIRDWSHGAKQWECNRS